MTRINVRLGRITIGLLLLSAAPAALSAQWVTTYEQFYYPGSFNWQFRENYPSADRLFNGFDFGHAILYETLWTEPNAPAAELEQKWYDRLTKKILVNPPPVPLEEAAIEIAYAKLAPEAKQMFDWAHLLHRQIYDVWADERIPTDDKDAVIAKLIRYYKSRPDLAFSSKPKTMELMEGMPYSTAFRKNYPKFNGLIWAYHWLQVGLYEPLVTGKDKDERQTGIVAAVARFRQMIENPPTWMPRVMPMTPAIAPEFTKRYPEAAIIFDNLHSMHDVVSDILANLAVPRNRKRAEILLAARRYRDDTSYVMTEHAWREMASAMGVQNMGGPVMGVLEGFPTPTVARGAVMAGMDHSQHAAAAPQKPDEHAGHVMPADSTSPARDTSHAMHDSAGAKPDSGHAMHDMPHDMSADHMRDMMTLHMGLLEDPVIRRRIQSDTAMRRIMLDMIREMPPEHREHMEMMLREPAGIPIRKDGTTRATPTKTKATTSTKTKVAPTKAAPVDHSKHKP